MQNKTPKETTHSYLDSTASKSILESCTAFTTFVGQPRSGRRHLFGAQKSNEQIVTPGGASKGGND
jgi:hypothetical protein